MTTTWAQSTTLVGSSTVLTSTPIALDPLSKMTSVQLTLTPGSSTTGLLTTFYVEATLDTPAFSAAGTGGVLPQPQPIWGQVGSSAYITVTSSTTTGVINSSQNTNLSIFDNSAMFVLLQPVAGLRLISSAGGFVGGASATLRALQSPSA